MRLAGMASPRDFALAAFGGQKTKGGNLTTQLNRLSASNPDAGLMVDQLEAYARAARISVAWLITGRGSPNDGVYGGLTGEELQGLPDALVRATRALMELDSLSPKVALWAAEEALRSHRRKTLTPNDWLSRMRILIEDRGPGRATESGTRGAAKAPKARRKNGS